MKIRGAVIGREYERRNEVGVTGIDRGWPEWSNPGVLINTTGLQVIDLAEFRVASSIGRPRIICDCRVLCLLMQLLSAIWQSFINRAGKCDAVVGRKCETA